MKQGKRSHLGTQELSRSPAIDWNLCVKLANNKVAVAEEILMLVIQQLPRDLEAIKEAQAKPDYPELLRRVHKLHGALCYSGMPRLKEAVACLETALKQNHFDNAELKELSLRLEAEARTVLTSKLPVNG